MSTKSSDQAWFAEDSSRRHTILQLRASALRAVREYFENRGYLEVQTPLMVPSPGTEVHLDAFEIQGHPEARWLITSPEYQMKRLLSAGFNRIFQICPCFRRDEKGSRHEPEFTMVEWYQVGSTYEELLQETENLVAFVSQQVLGRTRVQLGNDTYELAPPWQRLSVEEAFQRFANQSALELAEDEERFFRVLVDEVEHHLGRNQPCFLFDYPAPMASLARLKAANPALAERTEAYIAGMELCNGYVELTDAHEQRSRHEHDLERRRVLAKPNYPLDERFLSALIQGLPPCVGMALGFDRLMMLLAGTQDIQDVIAFANARL